MKIVDEDALVGFLSYKTGYDFFRLEIMGFAPRQPILKIVTFVPSSVPLHDTDLTVDLLLLQLDPGCEYEGEIHY